MDKKSANGFQTKASEGGVQRKQLPYSVETPYGFHLDLDFLKYVDDIEKGNTIKRVHIQRRIKGPPKFSTLPRNFSLPGHGVRPAPRETAWSGTSTLGPKPKSRLTEVQQIYDFRASEGGTSSQSGRVPTSQGGGYVPLKPRDDVAGGVQDVDEKNVGLQNRPNLLRASSMPITLQQRKGSDSSSPDRIVGTPESGSTENMFRASPDITERRSVPQDRTGLHQQITVALKRVRELEEQVKTIPELKAQISSLREEREKLLLQLQAQVAASSSVSSDSRTHTKPQGHRPSEGLSLALTTQHTRETPDKALAKAAAVKQKEAHQEPVKEEMEKEVEEQTEKQDKQKDTLESPLNHAVQKLSQDVDLDGVKYGVATEEQPEDSESTKKLREKLMILETKLSQATKDLERTNSLLKEQLDENKVKEEKIIQLSEGLRVEVCTPEFERQRRESIDAGTETEKVVVANQETETESPGTVDQGTDTDRICIEVCIPTLATGSTDRGTESAETQAQEQVTEMEAELAAASPPRPRANSMERGTVTERIPTQDQMTETPVAERVNQVTETEGETVTDHPHRPRASSVDRGTETERVDTVDRVTETEAAQRVDQQTGTEMDRRPDNNPGRGAEAASHVRRNVNRERQEHVDAVVSVREEEVSERIQREEGDSESVSIQVVVESSIVVAESRAEQIVISEIVSQDESHTIESAAAAGESTESKTKKVITASDTERKEIITIIPKSEAKDITETQQTAAETIEKKETADAEIVPVEVKETPVTDLVVVEAEKAVPPVRPQRGRKSSAEQVQPLLPQAQAQTAPVRPRRGSSEAQKSQTQAKTLPQVQAEAQVQSQPEIQTPKQVPEVQVKQAPSVPQVEEQVKKPPEEKQPQSEPQAKTETKSPAPTLSEVQIRPKSIQAQPQPPSTTTKRDSKELKRGSSVTQPPGRVSGEAQTPPIRRASTDAQPQSQSSRRGSGEAHPPSKDVSEKQVQRKGSTETVQRRGSSEVKVSRRDSGESQPPSRASSDTVQRRGSSEAQAARRDSGEVQSTRRGSGESVQRRGSSEAQASRRDSVESQAKRRGSGETAQRRGSSEAQAARKDSGDAQTSRRGSSDSPTSPAALGQVVTRLTGLLGEQWAQLGSSSGTQQTASQQEAPSAQKQTAGKRAEATKGATAKFAGKAAPTASTGKPAGKPGPSKMSSIQSQLVSSLSVLSAFYSPGQKAASKQQEQGLKSIMKKNGVADKQGNKGAKKNLKFVGVNGGYETTSSEDSSGDEKSKVEVEEEDSSELEVETEEKEKETEPVEKPDEGAETQQTGAEASAEGEGAAAAAAAAAVKEEERGLLDPDGSQELLDDPAEREKVDKGFLDACVYVKDRMEEVSSPDKEMRQVLVVLYQEWFKISSQKDSQADTVRLYLRQVGLTTPTLLPYVVNLTDGNGNMALHYSVSHSNFPVVKLLLDTGLCETDNVNKAGYTPVMLAALTAAETPDDLEVAQQLLKLGDINACSRQAGQTALMLAVSHGRVAMVKLLLSCGADVNAQDREGSTALMCASEHGHTHIVRLLLETGCCDSSLSDKNGQTALSVAEGASHTDIVDLLKAHAASSEPSSTADLL